LKKTNRKMIIQKRKFLSSRVKSTGSATIENEFQNLYYEQINW